MPHRSFNRLASKVGDPTDRKLTLVNMTARCGSTLLAQMVSRVPGVRAMSEPWSLVHVHGHFICRQISMAEYRVLLRSLVRLLCKKEHKKEVDHIFIKTTTLMSPAFPMLMEMFPTAKFVFNTRNFKPSFESWLSIKINGAFNLFLAYHTGELAKVCCISSVQVYPVNFSDH